jgi:hypothetical protein
MMVHKELKKLPSMLHEHECVLNLVQGRYEGNQGLIVATDRRVMFIDEGIVRSHREDFAPGQQPAQPPVSAAASQPDAYDKLRKLGELRDAGVRTTEEFDVKKTALLADL